MGYPFLAYRGNFSLAAGIGYEGALRLAKYPNGYFEAAIVGASLRSWRLTYSALHRRVSVRLSNGERASRLNYIWGIYTQSKSGGNRPFILRCPRDEKLYLAVFSDDRLEMQLVDHHLATCGLSIEQVNVKGVPTNADGSVSESLIDPDA